ncbi:type I 3-dehydroquinate dehydratase [Lactococcus piscium]|uniref:type I 3-dehydroquinate dehydratase n=1 Tax=Pseudolactococcus carnosus TaxID=2749961 RepID=UPI001FBA2D7C|nr:type I 3-dehydroquinate dehydratase [Lactococcus carnosus]MCJ1995427.1 type I 3-dehydroquinate dehydratase [Lactococcus carnosus]
MKIVVPIMPKSLEAIEQLSSDQYQGADLIEWRADFLAISDLDLAASKIKDKFPDHPIIFTFRTEDKDEQFISDADYVRLIDKFASEFAYIDIEVLRFPEVSIPQNAIASYHDFDQIPENLPEILDKMQARHPKVVKFAGMPQNKRDVLRLMSETLTFSEKHPDQIVVTMAMGELGKVTRLVGDSFGSSWTFAAVAATSAPGQLSLTEMRQVQHIL